MGYRSLNHHVACEPFAKHGIQKTVAASGLVMAENYSTLTPLRILADYPEHQIWTGATALVLGNLNNQPWAKDIRTLPDGTKFILVPLQHIALVKASDPLPPCLPGDPV